jgi:hypothetical protein
MEIGDCERDRNTEQGRMGKATLDIQYATIPGRVPCLPEQMIANDRVEERRIPRWADKVGGVRPSIPVQQAALSLVDLPVV